MGIKKTVKKCLFKLKYGNQIKLEAKTNIGKKTKFGGNNLISYGSDFEGEIGFSSYMGKNCKINAVIGKFCSIGDNVCVISGNHPSRDFVTSSPVMYSKLNICPKTFAQKQLFENEFIYADEDKKTSVIIGNDVWIGSYAKILSGVTIGDGAIIGAGAVVVKDVEPYSVVVGVPAKEIRKRFSQEQIDFLLKDKWWDKPEDWLIKNYHLFNNVEKYKNECSDE